MEVSGVRSACVTESSKAVRKRSPSRAASVWPSCSTARARSMATAISVPMASRVWRERIVPGNSQAANGAHAHRTGTKQRLLRMHRSLALRAPHRFEALYIEMRNSRPGAIYFLFFGEKKRAAPTSNVSTICAGIRLSSSITLPDSRRLLAEE